MGDRESISNCSYFSDLRNFHKFIKTTGPLSFNELRNTTISGFYYLKSSYVLLKMKLNCIVVDLVVSVTVRSGSFPKSIARYLKL